MGVTRPTRRGHPGLGVILLAMMLLPQPVRADESHAGTRAGSTPPDRKGWDMEMTSLQAVPALRDTTTQAMRALDVVAAETERMVLYLDQYADAMDLLEKASSASLSGMTLADIRESIGVFEIISSTIDDGVGIIDGPGIRERRKVMADGLAQAQLDVLPELRRGLGAAIEASSAGRSLKVLTMGPRYRTAVIISERFRFRHQAGEVAKRLSPILVRLRFDEVRFHRVLDEDPVLTLTPPSPADDKIMAISAGKQPSITILR